MARRLPLALLILPFLLTAPAAGDTYDRKQNVDSRIAALEQKMEAAAAREDTLAARIESVTADIQSLQRTVGDVSRKLDSLEHDLSLHRQRLAQLTELLRLQTERLDFLRGQYTTALKRLDRRLVALYKEDDVDTIDVVVSASSFADALDQLDYMRDLGDLDADISAQVRVSRNEMRVLRAKTKGTQERVAAATRVIAVRTAQTLELQNTLLARQSGLVAAKRSHAAALSTVRDTHEGYEDEAASLQAVSAQLADQIAAAQATSAQSVSPVAATGGPSAAGFVWPVSGPVVSGFGWRWGRMHEGIDIGAGTGTPIVAVAAGTVISAGWMGGYGNLVVIDHGGGVASAYAHLSSFAAGFGQRVGQGQVIGYVGCTGHCYGPHLHFEVRVNGGAVDPLGYL